MKNPIFFLVCSAILLLFGLKKLKAQHNQGQNTIMFLTGEWNLALDPLDIGSDRAWYKHETKTTYWDKVEVPHSFSSDKRFENYTGTVWYKNFFNWDLSPEKIVFINFDAVYYFTAIWINGNKVGEHEGGYTPFKFDITKYLKNGRNEIAVRVNNNTWSTRTIPGLKDNGDPNPFVGWMNYGGITRSVYIAEKPEAYIENVKVDAKPDLENGDAQLSFSVLIKDLTKKKIEDYPSFEIKSEEEDVTFQILDSSFLRKTDSDFLFETKVYLDPQMTRLWEITNPHLYNLRVVFNTDTFSVNFGIREIMIRDNAFLINGKPIRAAGANRVVDFPGLGSAEPDSIVEKDFKLMKEAGMVFQRLTHYPPRDYFYDLADKYGMLIVSEAGNWQLTEKQMEDEGIRDTYKRQLKEMMERDWNHPSIIAYSVGNEYMSDTQAGMKWTKDMIEFAKTIDDTRLFTFASYRLNELPETADGEASMYCDFISTNTYNNHKVVIEHIHKLYPDKPIFISEWGKRVDYGNDSLVSNHVKEIKSFIKQYPFIIGASYWSFNDYESRYRGTNKNGYREWGLVDPHRRPRKSYEVFQKEMNPIEIRIDSTRRTDIEGSSKIELFISVINTLGFPSFNACNYSLFLNDNKYKIPCLNPGDSYAIRYMLAESKGAELNIELRLLDKFRVFKRTVKNTINETTKM